ncbi:MAG: oxygen-independent coproporphyrinogen-3 oxidase, partial [Lysobacterales bacterium]
NSRFYTKKVQLLADQAQSEQYGLIMKRAYEHGFLQYEVSNFAKEGCQSVHNQKYWQCKDCIGLGVGAHGFINARRYSNESRLIDYIKLIESDEEIISYTESLTVEQQFNEAVVFGLRMNKGIVLKDIEEYYDFQLREDKRNKINHMIAEDLLVHEEDFLRVTDKGRYVLDSISAELI